MWVARPFIGKRNSEHWFVGKVQNVMKKATTTPEGA
jgi:hypothetical protein